MANTLAYYDRAKITSVKCFIAQVPEVLAALNLYCKSSHGCQNKLVRLLLENNFFIFFSKAELPSVLTTRLWSGISIMYCSGITIIYCSDITIMYCSGRTIMYCSGSAIITCCTDITVKYCSAVMYCPGNAILYSSGV
jgi:hypothetical protein